MHVSLPLPLILLCWTACCLLWPPASARGIVPGPQAESIPGLREAAIWGRLAATYGPARAEPDNPAAQLAFIAAFPTDPEAFAAVLRLAQSAPGAEGESVLLDWLLGLSQAQDRPVRHKARRCLRALEPTRQIRAAEKIYAAANAWGCEDLLELSRSPDPVVSVGALLLARDMAYAPKAEAALRSLRPNDPTEARLLKLAAIIAWNGEAAFPDLNREFVRAFPGTPRELKRLLDWERALCRYDDSLALTVLQRLARVDASDYASQARAKWRAAQALGRAEPGRPLPFCARRMAQALKPLFADPDPDVRATAMLYGARLTSPGPLRAWLLKHADPAEPPYVKTIRAYCLARWSPSDPGRQQRFLQRFFINWEAFRQEILFEDFTALSTRNSCLAWVCRLSLEPLAAGGRHDNILRFARENLLAVHHSLARERRQRPFPGYKKRLDRQILTALSGWENQPIFAQDDVQSLRGQKSPGQGQYIHSRAAQGMSLTRAKNQATLRKRQAE